MQVAAHIVEKCPFLLESDRLRLGPGLAFDLRRHTLWDELGIEHRLRPPSGCIIYALASGCSVARVRHLASEHGIAELQISELLGFLNALGGLVRERRLRLVPVAWLTQLKHSVVSVRYSPVAWRRTASANMVLLGTVRASRPVMLAAGLVGLLAAAGGVLPPKDSCMVVCFGILLFLTSLLAHELVHVLIAKRNSAPVALLQTGMRLGVIHRPLAPRAELCSALAGPAGGLAVGVLGAAAAAWYAPPLGWLGLAIGLFHLGGFLPWYGDSLSLRRALGRRHEITP